MKTKINLFKLLLITLTIISCSSDDGSDTDTTGDENAFTVATDTYGITNAYLLRNDLGNSGFYTILLTKGEILDINSNPPLYSNDFEHGIGFTVRVPIDASTLPSTTFNYDSDGNSLSYLYGFGFTNNYVIANNEVQSYNSVLNENDVVNEEARIIVSHLNNGNYNFNFNAITTLGQLNGSYTGSVEIIE
jgi:hypothetical protein